MNPEGIALVATAMFLLITFIALGGVIARMTERDRKARKKMAEEIDQDKTADS